MYIAYIHISTKYLKSFCSGDFANIGLGDYPRGMLLEDIVGQRISSIQRVREEAKSVNNG